MGADIHGVLQSRWGDGDVWFTECEIERERHYTLFAILGDVRNYFGINPIAPDRGFPNDFSVTDDGAHGGVWMGDHSFTWLTLEEIRDWPGWDVERSGVQTWTARDVCETFLKWVDYAASKCGGYNKGRIVIGFDS